MRSEQNCGWIEVVCGSMFSGKSEELIRRVKRAQIARQKVQVFKPSIDKRYSATEIVSHSGFVTEAILATEPEEIFEHLKEETQVVAIDEVQFFSNKIVDVCQRLANSGRRVVIAGLDQDFRGTPFGSMPVLLSIAEKVEKLRAICVVCGKEASRSQRIINGSPASCDSPTILVGAAESYEARCRACHKLPEEARVG